MKYTHQPGNSDNDDNLLALNLPELCHQCHLSFLSVFLFLGAFPGLVNVYFFLIPNRVKAVLARSFGQPCTSFRCRGRWTTCDPHDGTGQVFCGRCVPESKLFFLLRLFSFFMLAGAFKEKLKEKKTLMVHSVYF